MSPGPCQIARASVSQLEGPTSALQVTSASEAVAGVKEGPRRQETPVLPVDSCGLSPRAGHHIQTMADHVEVQLMVGRRPTQHGGGQCLHHHAASSVVQAFLQGRVDRCHHHMPGLGRPPTHMDALGHLAIQVLNQTGHQAASCQKGNHVMAVLQLLVAQTAQRRAMTQCMHR